MGRKSKYSKEIKLEIVKRYLKGESASVLANEYCIDGIVPSKVIKVWVHKFENLGEKTFEETKRNKTYSKEFKEKVIKEYLLGGTSYYELANKHNISSNVIVRNWVLKYNQGIEVKDYDPKGDVYTMKARKTTLEERIEIVNYVLSHNKDYKGAADKYSVPYASVYQWMQKFQLDGEDSLKDRRGRPSTSKLIQELTIEEKQAIKIAKLERELERQKMINEVLKKTSKFKNKWNEILESCTGRQISNNRGIQR